MEFVNGDNVLCMVTVSNAVCMCCELNLMYVKSFHSVISYDLNIAESIACILFGPLHTGMHISI